MTTFKQHEEAFDNNPKRFILRAILWLFLIGVIMSSIGWALGWFSEAAVVAKEEFGARASLKKYEWFKDASETINEKQQTILVYQGNISSMQEDYKGTPRKDWDRLDKQQFNQWKLELSGLKANYNSIVKEYNAQSSKFNWSMYNTSHLPEHFDLYITQ